MQHLREFQRLLQSQRPEFRDRACVRGVRHDCKIIRGTAAAAALTTLFEQMLPSWGNFLVCLPRAISDELSI